MIKLIIGNKGSGKTKKLVDLVNSRAETSVGNVVCLEKTPNLTYDISSRARLLEADVYNIKGYEALYGFLAGVCAGNYDITDVFVDATFKIVGRNYDALPAFFEKIEELSLQSDADFVFTISCDVTELPEDVFKFAENLEIR